MKEQRRSSLSGKFRCAFCCRHANLPHNSRCCAVWKGLKGLMDMICLDVVECAYRNCKLPLRSLRVTPCRPLQQHLRLAHGLFCKKRPQCLIHTSRQPDSQPCCHRSSSCCCQRQGIRYRDYSSRGGHRRGGCAAGGGNAGQSAQVDLRSGVLLGQHAGKKRPFWCASTMTWIANELSPMQGMPQQA
jgi:hypothetical protein